MEIDFYNQPKRDLLPEIEKPVEASPFDIVNNINEKKGHIADVVSEGGFIPWVINKSLSFHSSDVLYANEMNMNARQLWVILNALGLRRRKIFVCCLPNRRR